MKDLPTGSLLHPKIAKFYNININDIGSGNSVDYINGNGTYNWCKLEKLLLAERQWSTNDPVYPKGYNEYYSYFQLLQPVLHQSDTFLAQTNDSLNKRLITKLNWLGHETRMPVIIQEHLHPTSVTSTVENVLFLTSVLENGLGNIFYTITNKSPPHLLRDLLDTKELRDVFGICPILFLKIIFGSPDSLNLRNIVWHGFPLPSEVPPCYTATLLIIAASISTLINEKQMPLKSRPHVVDLSRFVSKMKDESIDFSLLSDVPRMESAIASSVWTAHSEHKIFWSQILKHHQNKNYWQLCILILPQIELLLRRLYGEANQFDITAKLEEYYITMNTIFESKDNGLLTGDLCVGKLHFLYDMFITPYGMRIRDKVSHGEVEFTCIGKELCDMLLYAAMNFITSNVQFPLDKYKTRFHLNYLAFECIQAAHRSVSEVFQLKTPSCCEIEFIWPQESWDPLQRIKSMRPAHIFDRHKKEPEVVALLMRIGQLVVQVCENYQASFAERFRMLVNHELRSRSRKTLEKMVQTMSVVGVTLGNVVRYLVGLNNRIQAEDPIWLEEKFPSIQKFCKQALTIFENVTRFSDKDSNEWLNVVDCCARFDKISSEVEKMLS